MASRQKISPFGLWLAIAGVARETVAEKKNMSGDR